ncbi:MAG: heavy-metal-associated domain-containing protein [Chitinophagales bacterium]
MKYLMIMLFSFSFLNFGVDANAQKKAKDHFTVQVDGLGCAFCAYGLEKKVSELKGIKNIKIELEVGMLDFDYPTAKALTINEIEEQVTLAGYTPMSVVVKRANGEIEKNEVVKNVINEAAEIEEATFFVAGNCGMCKARIEKNAKSLSGVSEATWNGETQELSIKFDAEKNTIAAIAETIAKIGHDTETAKAEKETYESLPACCHYERVE